jgi:hypothetical protein
MVWIGEGHHALNAFNAVKKNGVMLYPVSAAQYVNGAWSQKEVQLYQDGEWTQLWNGILYDQGKQYIPITGGWKMGHVSSNHTASGASG